MGTRSLLGLAVLILGIPATRAAEKETKEVAKQVAPISAGVGRRVPDVKNAAVDGKEYQLSEALKDRKALVVAVTSTSCPISKKYLPTLAKLEKDYGAKGVGFLLLNPIATDSVEEIKKQVAASAFQGPYFHDKDGSITKSLGLTTTTEVFVIDPTRTMAYRGAIDDQYGIGYSNDAPKRTYLKDALDAVLAGKEPAVRATSAPGCVLDLDSAKAVAAPKVTYHNRISRMIQQNCLECHRTGGVGPFTLNTLEDVVSHKAMIQKVVEKATMPPWFAAKPAKGEHSPFVNDRALPDEDKTDLLAWFKDGAPAGEKADAPLTRPFPEDWAIGKPDQIFQLDVPIDIKATGVMAYQNLIVDTKLDEEKWIQSYEVHPTAKEVVHHVLIWALPPKTGTELLPPRARGGEASGFFAAYVPGNSFQIFPENFGKKLPKGARLHFQIHYTPNGTATTDRMQIGVKYAAKKPETELKVFGLANPKFEIPPGDDNYKNTAEIKLPFNVTLTGLMPHMHVRGKACKYVAEFPDGTKKVLLDVPHYDFNWQLGYKLAEPALLPRGTKIIYTAWFDNSEKNPANPDPKKTVKWGPQTFDEMLLGYIEFHMTK